MKEGLRRPEGLAALPWIAAGLLWFGLVAPMRAGQETLLAEQSRIRRDRLKSDRLARETKAMSARAAAALSSACRASTDPALLRQRVVAATTGLNLSPFALSVTGGAAGGALVETEGPRSDVQELLRRLGDPARGGFLRSVTVRQTGSRWTASAVTGLVGPAPPGVLPTMAACGNKTEESPAETPHAAQPSPTPRRGTVRSVSPAPSAAITPPTLVPAPEPSAPFRLVGFLSADGRSRVSLRTGSEVQIVSVGDRILGWTCVSIDRDEGAVFTSPEGARLVLRATGEGGR